MQLDGKLNFWCVSQLLRPGMVAVIFGLDNNYGLATHSAVAIASYARNAAGRAVLFVN